MLARLAPLALALVLAACGSSPSDAERRGTSLDSLLVSTVDTVVDSLDARLGLSDEQRESIRTSLETRQADLRLTRSLPTRRERQAARERARTEADARILAALTTPQRESFAVLLAERSAERDPRVTRELNRLRQRLTLTDEQANVIVGLLESELDEIEVLVAQYRREGGREIPEVRDEIREIQERTDELIRAELTEEQQQEFAALRADDRRGRR